MSSDDLRLIKDIVADYESIKSALTKAKTVKDKLINLCLSKQISERAFYKVSSLLTPQSRSALWEKYFIEKHNAQKVGAKENAGDLVIGGTNHEYKSSFNDDGLVHIVQVRLWQRCDYVIQVITLGDVFTFRLTHREMEKEMGALKATSAHGTAEANINNENVELRATFKIGGSHWNRWIKQYRKPPLAREACGAKGLRAG